MLKFILGIVLGAFLGIFTCSSFIIDASIDRKVEDHTLYTNEQVDSLLIDHYIMSAQQGYQLGQVHALNSQIDSVAILARVPLPHDTLEIILVFSEVIDEN